MPPAQARECTRALTSVKLDRVFATSLLGVLDGRADDIFCSTTSAHSVVQFSSGDAQIFLGL